MAKIRNLIPMLVVADIHKSIAFYQDYLKFEVMGKFEDEGELCWVSTRCGNTELMLTRASQCQPATIDPVAKERVIFYFYPDNVDELYSELKSKGLAVTDLRDTEYEMREFEIKDPDGNWLWFGQEIEH